MRAFSTFINLKEILQMGGKCIIVAHMFLCINFIMPSFQAGELGSPEAMRERADVMLQRALIMFPGLLLPLLDKCSIQPDPEVASHDFFGPKAQTE